MHGNSPDIDQQRNGPSMPASMRGIRNERNGMRRGIHRVLKERNQKAISEVGELLDQAGFTAEFGKPTKKPQELTFTDGEIRGLDAELKHIESLVTPYKENIHEGLTDKTDIKAENIVRYLHSFESALALVKRAVHPSNKLLTLNNGRLAAAKTYQKRLAEIEEEITKRRLEVLGDTSIFHGKCVITFDREGNQKSRIIESIEYNWGEESMPEEIFVKFQNGDTEKLATLYRSLQQPVRYGPDSDDRNSINQYINYCFNPHKDLIEDVTHHSDEAVITLKTKSGRKWTLRCKIKPNTTAQGGSPELIIQHVRNWQVVIPDHLLDSYTNDRVTRGSISGLVGYIARDEEISNIKPKSWFERLESKAGKLWESGARIFNKWENGSRLIHRLLK